MLLGSSEPTFEAETKATPLFARFARWVERQVGRSSTFVLAIAVVLLWAVSGPLFGWSDTWQLVINTGTTIVTFLMVFVIQNTQSRDTQAMQLKLDELIRVNEMARNSLINLEEMSDIDVERMKAAFAALASLEPSTSRSMQVADIPRQHSFVRTESRRLAAQTAGPSSAAPQSSCWRRPGPDKPFGRRRSSTVSTTCATDVARRRSAPSRPARPGFPVAAPVAGQRWRASVGRVQHSIATRSRTTRRKPHE
jgi:low affinity Fe/Cu permease